MAINKGENVMEENNKDTQVVEETKVEETTQKTYTQEDLDNSFNAGRKKASHDWQKDEKYQEFVAWKKNNQNDSEKMSELQTNFDKVSSENKYLKSLIEVNNSDVKKEFSKFVTSEVMSMVNDTTDFETALKTYKDKNPQYFGEVVVKKVQSSPNLNNGGNKPTTTSDIMNDILRGAKNN